MRSVLRELLWGGITGGVIAGVIGVPATLLVNLWLCWHTQLDGRSHFIDMVIVLASTVLAIVLLTILIPALRKTAAQGNKERQQQVPDLRWGAKFGGTLGTIVSTGVAIYLWSVWINIFRQEQIPIDAWHMATVVCVSIVGILAAGCMGAIAVVIGFILADQGRLLTREQKRNKGDCAKKLGKGGQRA
ncbi:MAG: hypothetical protein ACWGMZ_03320 [Thermoguttaceae bacterium]